MSEMFQNYKTSICNYFGWPQTCFFFLLISVWQLHFADGIICLSFSLTLIFNLSANTIVFIFKIYKNIFLSNPYIISSFIGTSFFCWSPSLSTPTFDIPTVCSPQGDQSDPFKIEIRYFSSIPNVQEPPISVRMKCQAVTSPSMAGSWKPALTTFHNPLLLIYCFSDLMGSLLFLKQLSMSLPQGICITVPLPRGFFPLVGRWLALQLHQTLLKHHIFKRSLSLTVCAERHILTSVS